MKTTLTNTKISLNRFLAICDIEVVTNNDFTAVSDLFPEVYINVNITEGVYRIDECEGVEKPWNDNQIKILFDAVEEKFNELNGVDTSDYEHPSIAGGIYNGLY